MNVPFVVARSAVSATMDMGVGTLDLCEIYFTMPMTLNFAF